MGPGGPPGRVGTPVEQSVALGRVVLHARQGAADLAEGLVVKPTAVIALHHQRASLRRVDAWSR
ncbi:hypothetical protein SALBM311S_05191 [Streptomyces alboniger]